MQLRRAACTVQDNHVSHNLKAWAATHASNLKTSLDVTCGTVQALTDLDAARERSQAEVRHLREGFQQQLEEARTLATESKQAAAAAAGSVGQWRNRWGGVGTLNLKAESVPVCRSGVVHP